MRLHHRMSMGLIAALAICHCADAAILSQVSGNSRATGFNSLVPAIPFVDGSASFAVFSNTGGAGDVFGTGFAGFDTSAFSAGIDGLGGFSAAFDTTAKFLYAYQLVNDGSSAVVIRQLTVSLNNNPSSAATSWGFFGGLGFFDGAAVAASNPFGNNGPFVGPGTAPADTIGALGGPYVSAAAPDRVPNLIGQNGVLNSGGQISISFNPLTLNAGQRSPLIVFTSNLAPTFITAPMQDGGALPASLTVPTLVPEPGSLLLLFAGAPGLAITTWRRRRTQAA